MATTTSEGEEFTIRPGWIQVLAWGVFTAGVALRAVSLAEEQPPLYVFVVAGAIWMAYLLGARVRLTADRLEKSYFFGAWRRAIARSQLTMGHHLARGGREREIPLWTVDDFKSTDGEGFSLVPFWVWSRADIEAVWDHVHPRPSLFGPGANPV